MKNKNIIEKKPYLTKQELSILLDKEGKNLDKKIQSLLDKKELISLKKGVYVNHAYLLQANKKYPKFVANILYYPSYLSLEYILQKENIIPEAVYAYTSITNKKTRRFDNQIGNFIYRSVKDELFTGFEETPFTENYKIKQATRAKALFDWLYLTTFENSFKKALKINLRINWTMIKKADLEEFKKYVELSQMKKMEKIYKILQEEIL